MNEFRKYATKHLGMNGNALDSYMNITSSYISPTIIEERQLNVAQMDVFSRLMMDRIIFLGTQVDDYTANVIQAQLLYLDSSDPGKDISIHNNSPGGSVYAGYGIYDTMQFINSDVSTICTGMAASFAAVLLVAGTKGKRMALPHSRVMIHQPLGGAYGQASDVELIAEHMCKVKRKLNEILASNTGKPLKQIIVDTDRDYYLGAEEAVEYGLVDKIIG
jgi:ATP-dependent Clp protease protease subunit